MKTPRELREDARLSSHQLASKAMVDESVIPLLENGQHVPSLDQFRRICDVLGVSMETVALHPWDQILRTHRLWYHLHAHHTDSGWLARCNGIDFSERIPRNDRFGTLPELSQPMDETDPTSTSVEAPLTWKWEETGASAEEAIQKLSSRITQALDRSDR